MKPYRCAVMGNPIAHSQSPQIHAGFAKDYGIELRYDKLLVPLHGFKQAVANFFKDNNKFIPKGLNITLPFKVKAFELAERLTDHAQYAGAVNTLYYANGVLVGDNTDGIGLCSALTQTHGYSLQHKTVLLLGAGGAARGVVYPLLESGISQLTIANRTLTKAQAVMDTQQKINPAIKIKALPLNKLGAQPFDVIINATSAGLSDNTFALPAGLVHSKSICYDMVYGKETPFMHWAHRQGVSHCHDGHSMLIAQAWYSFKRWFDV